MANTNLYNILKNFKESCEEDTLRKEFITKIKTLDKDQMDENAELEKTNNIKLGIYDASIYNSKKEKIKGMTDTRNTILMIQNKEYKIDKLRFKIILNSLGKKFLCIFTNNYEQKWYIFFSILFNNLARCEYTYKGEYIIDKEQYCIRLECIEIECYVNLKYITTKNDCNTNTNINTNCKGLATLFYQLYDFFKTINYNGSIKLEDDSMIQKDDKSIPISLLLFRILTGKESIYSEYGFVFYPEKKEEIRKLLLQLQDDPNIKKIRETKPTLIDKIINGTLNKTYINLIEEVSDKKKLETLKTALRTVPMICVSYWTSKNKCKAGSESNIIGGFIKKKHLSHKVYKLIKN